MTWFEVLVIIGLYVVIFLLVASGIKIGGEMSKKDNKWYGPKGLPGVLEMFKAENTHIMIKYREQLNNDGVDKQVVSRNCIVVRDFLDNVLPSMGILLVKES